MTPIGYNANTLQERKAAWSLLDLYSCFSNIDTRREVDNATYGSILKAVNLEVV